MSPLHLREMKHKRLAAATRACFLMDRHGPQNEQYKDAHQRCVRLLKRHRQAQEDMQ